ncbi:hypothetical protein AVEN_212482-1 [Araneus ventricosus]|uniref:Uncharacterized protein n=1 Tax=Araneus ventricosus TaxID=182803 RepID=A0A4Y2K090_ARAVE|nr:hypothetical protein AVEN_212482-1 [Araneus ventricosus]
MEISWLLIRRAPGSKFDRSDFEIRFHYRSSVFVCLVRLKSDVGQTSSRWCGAEVCGRSHRLRCRPRHLTVVQNEEVYPKITLWLLQKSGP